MKTINFSVLEKIGLNQNLIGNLPIDEILLLIDDLNLILNQKPDYFWSSIFRIEKIQKGKESMLKQIETQICSIKKSIPQVAKIEELGFNMTVNSCFSVCFVRNNLIEKNQINGFYFNRNGSIEVKENFFLSEQDFDKISKILKGNLK